MKQKSILQSKMSLEATPPPPHDFEVDGIYYKYNGDGTVSVTFKGSSHNEYANVYTGDVTIPSSVTYSGTTYSVTSIGNSAFEGCSGLTSVTIPNSVTSIGDRAFRGCSCFWSGLTSVTIGNSVTSIGDSAFEGCSGLTSVTIPNSINSIGSGAFQGCSGLVSIVVESGNSKYDSRDNCNAIIETATNTLLAGCKNTTIPNSVTSIGNYAFYHCSGLKSVTIPNSVTSIMLFAFSGCSGLKSVTIPNSVTSIWDLAFSDCSGLTRVDISSIEAWLGIKFADNYSNPLYYARHLYLNGEEVKDLVIPNSVNSIGSLAFYNCSGLKSVTIPNPVTSIGTYAFYGCSGLKSVTIPNSVTSIGEAAFYDCSGLTSVTIPNSVTSIGTYAFRGCSGMTSITIPNSVTSIGECAFDGCSSLTSVTIPNSVTSIGDYVFRSCSSLTSVSIPNSVTSIGRDAFWECSGLTSITIPNSVTSIGNYAFEGCSGLETIFYNAENCADVTSDSRVFTFGTNIIIGKDVKKVPNYLFDSLENTPACVISQSVTTPTCGANTFNDKAKGAKLYVPSEAESDYFMADVWCDFTIATVDKPVTSIVLSESEATITIVSTKQLTATAAPSDATIADIFEWSSSNPEVAVVDENGLVSAVGEGTTVITAKALDGSKVTGTCNITVRSFNPTSITLNHSELNMFVKEYTSLTYTILPEDAIVKTAEWSVSDSNVLSYREMDNGSLKIVANSAGTATITARTTDGSNLEATCVVTVDAGV